MTRDSLSLVVDLSLLGVLLVMIWQHRDALPLLSRFVRRELPKTTLTIQTSQPARPLTEPAKKGISRASVVDIRKGRLFGTSPREYAQLERQRLRAIAQRGHGGAA